MGKPATGVAEHRGVEQPDGPGPATDDTVGRLVAAAIEVFAEKGYDGAGVAEIARRAGLSTGAIYSRFSGKAELLAEAIAAAGGGELDRLFAQAVEGASVTDIFAAIGSHLIDSPDPTDRALLLEAFAAARRDPDVALLLRGALEHRAAALAALIDAGKAEGTIDANLDTAAIVQFAHAVGLGFVLSGTVGADTPDPAAWNELILRVVGSVAPSTATPDPTAPSTT